jgi:hypothetical protein
LYGGNTYTLLAEAITLPYYSHAFAPAGFPPERSVWDLLAAFNGSTTAPTPNIWYNYGSLLLPIGDWTVTVLPKCFFYRGGALPAGTIACDAHVTLSNAVNTELSYMETRTMKYNAYRESGSNLELYATLPIIKNYTLTSKETKYVNMKSAYAAEGIGCQSGSQIIARFNYV